MFVFPKDCSDRSDQNWPNTKFFDFFCGNENSILGQYLISISLGDWKKNIHILYIICFNSWVEETFWKVDLLKLMMSEPSNWNWNDLGVTTMVVRCFLLDLFLSQSKQSFAFYGMINYENIEYGIEIRVLKVFMNF